MTTSDKVCPTSNDIVIYVLPILVVEYLIAVLVQLKNTTLLRVALLPFLPWLVFRAVSTLDFSCGLQTQVHLNPGFFTHMTTVTMRTTTWALTRQLYRRDNVPVAESTTVPMALWNAWDLLLNLRGIGWNWSQGVPIPQPSVKTESRLWFLLHACIQVLFFTLALDAFTEAIRAFSPSFATSVGGSIIDQSLPVISRYMFICGISYLTVWMTFFSVQWGYYSLCVMCILIFGQHPSQWPPLFDDPWLSTSLSELWGIRWHQMLRQSFVSAGGVPLSYILGRPGIILGTFLASGIYHCIDVGAAWDGANPLQIAGFFFMNGVGILLERAWSKAMGRRIGGIYGWIWTFLWLLLWGIPVVDQWARSGRFAFEIIPQNPRPTMMLLSLVLPPGVDKGLVINCLCFGTTLLFLAYSLCTLC
ncbi:hypothetical protein ID866_9401 [Astraeus odoratus]|nr:hypothetical protein ID866_9401 [Astraeus odoratus]